MVAAAAAPWRVELDSRAFIAGKNTRQKEVGREIARARQRATNVNIPNWHLGTNMIIPSAFVLAG